MDNSKTKLERYLVQYEESAAKEKELRKKIKEEMRKRRDHLRIQMGIVIEKVLDRDLEEDDVRKLNGFLHRQEYNGKYFSRAMNEKTVDTPVNSEP